MLGISSDGDNRLLCAMKLRTTFDLVPDMDLIRRLVDVIISVQDGIHIGTKLRNRFLNSSIILLIGNKAVSPVHLQYLIDFVEKAVHGLVHSDIFTEDRQNFQSLQKIMEDRVLNALKQYVVDSEATIMYLELCKLITSAFIDEGLNTNERVYRIWYATYFIRAWRKWVLDNPNSTLERNFITNNAYVCLEINAHALIELIVKLRTMGQPNLFKPWLYSSQPCENTFRTLRSMGTANYTKINFNLNEVMHLIGRLEMVQKTVHGNQGIIFPRSVLKETEHAVILPSDNEILNEMLNARSNAIRKAAEFGMHVSETDITNTELQFSRQNQAEEIIALFQMFEEEENLDEETSQVETTQSTSTQIDSEPDPDFTMSIADEDGTIRTVRKSTFLWMMSESKHKLSSDRTKRWQEIGQSSAPTSKKFKPNTVTGDEPNIMQKEKLRIGDWSIFDIENAIIPNNFKPDGQKGYFIANIIGFRYQKDDSRTLPGSQQYKAGYLLTKRTNGAKHFLILGLWYLCNEDKLFKPCNGNISVSLDKYIATVKPPIVQKKDGKTNYALSFEYSELQRYIECSKQS